MSVRISPQSKAAEANSRMLGVDVLKTVALLCIVIAHAKPPIIISEPRNFDVTLMVILSGILLGNAGAVTLRDFPSYVLKRLSRIVPPVWVFLTTLFMGSALLSAIGLLKFPFSLRQIVGSYALGEGIGFVWILRIFLLMALTAPLWSYLNNRIRPTPLLLAVVLVGTVITTLAHSLAPSSLGANIAHYVDVTLLSVIPFGLAMTMGMRLAIANGLQRLVIGLTCLSLYGLVGIASYAFSETWPLTQEAKYPPQILYIAYGIGVSGILLACEGYLTSLFIPLRRLVTAISANSLWLYLWHIPFFFATAEKITAPHHILIPWPLKVIIMILGASALVAAQQMVLSRFLPLLSPRPRRAIKTLFAG